MQGQPPNEPVINVGHSVIFLNQSSAELLFWSPPGKPVDHPRVDGVVRNSYKAKNVITRGRINFLFKENNSRQL